MYRNAIMWLIFYYSKILLYFLFLVLTLTWFSNIWTVFFTVENYPNISLLFIDFFVRQKDSWEQSLSCSNLLLFVKWSNFSLCHLSPVITQTVQVMGNQKNIINTSVRLQKTKKLLFDVIICDSQMGFPVITNSPVC